MKLSKAQRFFLQAGEARERWKLAVRDWKYFFLINAPNRKMKANADRKRFFREYKRFIRLALEAEKELK